MPTLDLTTGGNTGVSANLKQMVVMEEQFEFTAANNPAAADVVQLMDIPKDFVVCGAMLRIDTAGTASGTGTLGITGDDADGFLTASALDAAADTFYYGDGAFLAALTGKMVAAADTLDMLIAGATMVAGKFTVYVWGFESKT